MVIIITDIICGANNKTDQDCFGVKRKGARLWVLYLSVDIYQKQTSKKVQKYVWIKGTRMWLVKISPTVVGKKEHLTPLRMWPRQLLTGWWSMKCLLVERGERACEPFENETAALLTSNWGSAPFQMFYVRANVYLMLNEMFVGDSVKEQTHLRMWHHLLLELRIRCFKCLPCVRMFGWCSIKCLLVERGSRCVETCFLFMFQMFRLENSSNV